jgi:hypothetical protein
MEVLNMKKKMGRPSEGRTIKVCVLFTAEEKALLDKVSELTGLTYSKIILRSFGTYAAQVLAKEENK